MTDMAATGGNCRAWSENVYTKLFLDPNNKSATLAVVKVKIKLETGEIFCQSSFRILEIRARGSYVYFQTEISYVDLFTDREHVLFRSRCIGKKTNVHELYIVVTQIEIISGHPRSLGVAPRFLPQNRCLI